MNNQKSEADNGERQRALSPATLLAAFVEYEEYIADECAALKSSPMTYHPDDRIGLPYILEAVQKIRQDCESRQAANARADLPRIDDVARESGCEGDNRVRSGTLLGMKI